MGVGKGVFGCGFWEWPVRTCGNLGLESRIGAVARKSVLLHS